MNDAYKSVAVDLKVAATRAAWALAEIDWQSIVDAESAMRVREMVDNATKVINSYLIVRERADLGGENVS